MPSQAKKISAIWQRVKLPKEFGPDEITLPAGPVRLIPFDHCNVSVRTARALQRNGVNVIGDLDGKRWSEMYNWPNCGRKTLREIQAVLLDATAPSYEGSNGMIPWRFVFFTMNDYAATG